MQNNKRININDLKNRIKRRRWGVIVPALIVFFLTLALLVVWKPVFRSTSTILIEEQEISRDYVMATVTSYAEQRLQMINQRIMSSTRLIGIINRFNLYADKRGRMTMDEIIEDMRTNDITFETITAEVVDRRTGRPTSATIAFTVSYEGKDPSVVQQVANTLATLYLEENIRVVEQQSSGTTKFLEDEMRAVQDDLAKLEGKIADYKEKNPFTMPELLQFNLQALDWTNKKLDQLNEDLRNLREKESEFKSQIASVKPDAKNQEQELLKELRAKLVLLRSKYSAEYPDVMKIKKEIADLSEGFELWPDSKSVRENPDNPSYVDLSARLAGIQSEITSVLRQIGENEAKQDDYIRRLQKSPRVEEGYKKLFVKRNNTQAKYDELMKKYMDARVAQGLEKNNIGERFTLIDPASYPEKPVRPNRVAVLLIGIILGFGAGIGNMALLEAVDQSARRSEDLTGSFPFPVLAEVAEIITSEDERRKRIRFRIVAGTSVIMFVGLTICIHFYFMDLEVLWARAARRVVRFKDLI